jgi:hypothetical protein
MTIIKDYTSAAALFTKARRPEKGKPLGVQHWRMFKDGDEFAVYYFDVLVARILPTNQLIVRGYKAGTTPQGVVATADRVLPLRIVRRGPSHYRAHCVVDPEGDIWSMFGVTDWDGMRTGGVHLWHDVTFDLTKRVWLSAPEVTKVIDETARKDWLVKSRHIRNVFATMIRLGAVEARMRAMKDAGQPWYTGRSLLTRPSSEDLALLADAVRMGVVSDRLADVFAQSVRRSCIGDMSVEVQLEHLSRVFQHNSLALRTVLGVITVK